ncbi:hypothetical protein D3C71_424330 [compost metagenome]
MQRLQLLRQRGQRDINASHTDHLAIGHDGIGERRHRRRHFRAFGEIGLRDRAFTGFGGKRIPFRRIIILERRELDFALLGFRPVRSEGAGGIGAEIEPVGDLRRLAVKKAELLTEPAAKGKGVLLDIGLQDVDDAGAIH